MVDINFPQAGVRGAVTLQDDRIVVADGDMIQGESDVTASIAKLPNGEQGLGGKVGYNVTVMCSRWEVGEGEFSLMCRVENSSRGGVDGNGRDRGMLIANGGGGGEQVQCAT